MNANRECHACAVNSINYNTDKSLEIQTEMDPAEDYFCVYYVCVCILYIYIYIYLAINEIS